MYAQNQLLRDVTDRLAHIQPTDEMWQSIIQMLKDDRRLQRTKDTQSIASLLAEGYVRWHVLQERRKLPELIEKSPIVNNDRTQGYRFEYDGGELNVYHLPDHNIPNRHRLPITGYDLIAVFDGLPTVFDVKITRYYHRRGSLRAQGGSKTRSAGSTLGVAGLFSCQERTEERLDPLKKYFKRDTLGYVVVIACNHVKKDDFKQQQFQKNGGIIVPFYTDSETFRTQDAPAIIEKFGLSS